MPNFMLLATAWGPKYGGINAFNMDFAIGLANHLGDQGEVFCSAFSPTLEDIADAEKKHVTLIGIDRPVDSPAYDPSWAWDVWRRFQEKCSGEQLDWWVGHDVTTGHAAVAGPIVASHGRSALIMHMNYADYQAYKTEVGERARKKVLEQRQLFPKAVRWFANGPLLTNALKEIVGPDVSMLIPGFADVHARPSSDRLNVITFGRMDRESDRVKQGALAVAGFASAVKQACSTEGSPEKLKDNPRMWVVGIKEPGGDEERTLIRLASERADREVNLFALTFDENRAQLFDELGRANISLMLSWHEGFGLTGWEAIAGEVPLILSRQTGLWKLLTDTFGGNFAAGYVRTIDVRGQSGHDDTVNFRPEDESDVCKAIIYCTAHLDEVRKAAVQLKRDLQEKLVCTWENTARQFLEGLGIEEPQPATPPNPVSQQTPQPVPRSDFIAIPRPSWPEGLGFEMPDSMLLRPESRIVHFHHLREPLRDEIIGWALNPDQLIKLRLQAGEGGAGKTRLLIEVCDQLEHSHGWRAGFVERSQSNPSGLLALLKDGKPCLIVLDYAETRTTEIVEITRTALYSSNPPNVRIVLLAREGGDWWDHLDAAAVGDQAVSAILRGIQTKTGPYRMANERIGKNDRNNIFNEALQAFAEGKQIAVPQIRPPDLSEDLFGNPLFIHLAALANLRGSPSVDDKELLAMAIGHERSYWRQLLSDEGMSDEMLPALEQALALLTLCNGKLTAKDAKAVLARAPRLRELDPSVRMKLFEALRRLYPLEGGLAGLRPDLIGETLISEALASDDEVLDAAFGQDCSREDTRSALTVLTRLGRRVPEEQRWLRRALERNLTKISDDALHVGMETGSPMPQILKQVVDAAGRNERKQTVSALRVKIPNETLNLRDFKVAILRHSIELLETKRTGQGAKHNIGLFEGFSGLSLALKQAGLLGEAADAARQAKHYAEITFRSDSNNDRNRLAAAFGNFGASLGDVGRFDEALAVAKKAEEIWRRLAEKQPDAYTADWATSLGNLGVRLSEVGRFDEALAATKKAEEIRRGLAEKQPNAYTADWATSLGNLANAQLAEEEFNNALETANGAILRILPFADRYPPIYKPWLGFAKRIAAESYLGMNKLEEALAEARCSVEIWTQVVTLRLNYESVQVAKAFRALMKCEIVLGQNEAAIITLGRAFDMLCKPLNDNPKPLSPVMSELVDLASAVDHDAVARAVPSELLAIVRSSS